MLCGIANLIRFVFIVSLYYFCCYYNITHHAHSVMVLLCHVLCGIPTLIILLSPPYVIYALLILTLFTMLILSWCYYVMCCVVAILWIFYYLIHMLFMHSKSDIVHHAHSVMVLLCHQLCGIPTLIILLYHPYVITLTCSTMLIQWWCDYIMCCMVSPLLLFSYLLPMLFMFVLFLHCSPWSFSDGVTMICVVWYR